MNTQTVKSGKDIVIIVQEATIRQDTIRARLRAEAFAESDLDKRALLLEYADLVPVTVEARGIPWPITVDQLADLPGKVGGLWERAALNLNPHWYMAPDPKESSETALASISD